MSGVRELLLIDQSQLISNSIRPGESLRNLLLRIEDVTDSLRNELSSVAAQEKAIGVALTRNRAECKLWEDRAAMAADDQINYLSNEALKWKREHEDIMTALRDEQVEINESLRILQDQLAALQAIGAHARRSLELFVARGSS